MSYLQRLTATVSPSAPRLRPLVGSIFAGPWQEAAAPAPPSAEPSAESKEGHPATARMRLSAAPEESAGGRSSAADDLVNRPDASALPAQARRAVEPRPDEGRPDDRRSGERSVHELPHEVFQPLLPRTAGEFDLTATRPDPALAHATSIRPAARGPQVEPLDPGVADAWRASDRAPQGGPSARGSIAPLATRGPNEGLPAPAPSAGESVARPRAEFAAPSRRSERGADDIHIHIGRVEVTAVPPAAPRPPAPPARKTMTLEEYLGRRNRGAR